MRNLRRDRKLCVACNRHKAISVVHGVAAWRHDHPLCPRCFRTALSQASALRQRTDTLSIESGGLAQRQVGSRMRPERVSEGLRFCVSWMWEAIG